MSIVSKIIDSNIDHHIEVIKEIKGSLIPEIEKVATLILDTLGAGKKILIFGNGGSAADAQHFAAEMVVRFMINRRALPAIALTTDSSIITAAGNDLSFENIFSRQVEAIANTGDLLIGISTSGNSNNVINGLKAGHSKNCILLGLSGYDGGKLNECTDVNIIIPSNEVARIQEGHILIIHIICAIIDNSIV